MKCNITNLEICRKEILWMDITEINLIEIGLGAMFWIYLIQDRKLNSRS
jgi:hypothetical protein